MKYAIVLAAVLVAVSALPTDYESKYSRNGTRNLLRDIMGFATGCQGGEGGPIWTVWDAWALRDAVSTNERRAVFVRGRIDLTVLFSNSPGVAVQVGSFKTIVGADGQAMIFGGGLSVRNNRHVTIQNIKFHNALSYAPGERPNGSGGILGMVPGPFSQIDALGIEVNAEYVWVHRCEFADDPWVNSGLIPESGRRHDGLIDITQGASWITISNCILRNHNLVSLNGNSDTMTTDIGRLKITWYHNWFQGGNQRNPFVRFGEVHVLNNLYTDVTDYGIGAGAGAQVYAERNVLRNVRRAWIANAPANNPGSFRNDNNLLINTALPTGIPDNTRWHPSNYYRYTPLNTANVEQNVRVFSGVWG